MQHLFHKQIFNQDTNNVDDEIPHRVVREYVDQVRDSIINWRERFASVLSRLALFGKPSDCFFSRANDYPRSRYSPLSTPITSRYSIICLYQKSVFFRSLLESQSNDNGFSLMKPPRLQMEKEYSFGEMLFTTNKY